MPLQLCQANDRLGYVPVRHIRVASLTMTLKGRAMDASMETYDCAEI